MCENGGVVASLRRSWRLVHGSTWRMAGYLLLIGLTVLLVSFLLGIPVGILALLVGGGASRLGTPAGAAAVYAEPGYLLVVSLFSVLISALVTPWYLSVLTLLYYDLRWRKGELAGSTTAQPSTTPYPGVPAS
jgi:ABC-type dipeptide/oligopeptide/nickel transport system permease component